MKLAELRNLNREELVVKLAAFKEQLSRLQYLKNVGQVDKPHQFKQIKKTIARIHTLLNEADMSKVDKKEEG